jgi:hypothetical protein
MNILSINDFHFNNVALPRFIASAGTYANLVRQAKSKQKIIDKMEAAGLIEKIEQPRPLRYDASPVILTLMLRLLIAFISKTSASYHRPLLHSTMSLSPIQARKKNIYTNISLSV